MEQNRKRVSGWTQLGYTETANTLPMPMQSVPMPPVAALPMQNEPMMPPVVALPVQNEPMMPPEALPVPMLPEIPMPEPSDCDDLMLVMAYVKKQKWEDTYEPEVGFGRGTIFPELDLPFVGEGACDYDE